MDNWTDFQIPFNLKYITNKMYFISVAIKAYSLENVCYHLIYAQIRLKSLRIVP